MFLWFPLCSEPLCHCFVSYLWVIKAKISVIFILAGLSDVIKWLNPLHIWLEMTMTARIQDHLLIILCFSVQASDQWRAAHSDPKNAGQKPRHQDHAFWDQGTMETDTGQTLNYKSASETFVFYAFRWISGWPREALIYCPLRRSTAQWWRWQRRRSRTQSSLSQASLQW